MHHASKNVPILIVFIVSTQIGINTLISQYHQIIVLFAMIHSYIYISTPRRPGIYQDTIIVTGSPEVGCLQEGLHCSAMIPSLCYTSTCNAFSLLIKSWTSTLLPIWLQPSRYNSKRPSQNRNWKYQGKSDMQHLPSSPLVILVSTVLQPVIWTTICHNDTACTNSCQCQSSRSCKYTY